jgi:hypothetical protein
MLLAAKRMCAQDLRRWWKGSLVVVMKMLTLKGFLVVVMKMLTSIEVSKHVHASDLIKV